MIICGQDAKLLVIISPSEYRNDKDCLGASIHCTDQQTPDNDGTIHKCIQQGSSHLKS